MNQVDLHVICQIMLQVTSRSDGPHGWARYQGPLRGQVTQSALGDEPPTEAHQIQDDNNAHSQPFDKSTTRYTVVDSKFSMSQSAQPLFELKSAK